MVRLGKKTILGAKVFVGSFIGVALAFGIVNTMLLTKPVTAGLALQGVIFATIFAVVSTAIELIFGQRQRRLEQPVANDL
ncbi:hypothetical protein [Brevundimonas sp.]|uniref:hypothetical protein n=1 Tax=Brevundimonas sp. TaxID=1871086 RepID=UPI003D10D9ED